MVKKLFFMMVCTMLMIGSLLTSVHAETPTIRIKDIARIDGVRDNQLMGYGLVIGLEGTGDSQRTEFTIQSISNMLERFGIRVPASNLSVRNVAAVMVTADLPAFAREGDRIDVTVSSLGDARSLQGGTLLLTPLMAPNQEVYAVAQGALSIGGFNVRSGGSRVQQNHAVVGRIPAGAIVERTIHTEFLGEEGTITYVMDYNDFATAQRIAEAINEYAGEKIASAVDGRSVEIQVPDAYEDMEILLIAEVGQLEITPDRMARVVINERTGTIVMGERVRVAPVAVSHGSLKVTIQSIPIISQPNSLSDGETVVENTSTIQVEESGSVAMIGEGADIQSIVNALNQIGASPRDTIAILQALKEAGALYADLLLI